MDKPLLIMPKGWTPATKTRDVRDATGKLHKVTVKTDDRTGRIAGNDRGYSHERVDPEGRQHAVVRMETVELRIPGMTRAALMMAVREAVRLFPDQSPRLTDSGIQLPGRSTSWQPR